MRLYGNPTAWYLFLATVCFLLFLSSRARRDRLLQGSPCALPKGAILPGPIIEEPGAVQASRGNSTNQNSFRKERYQYNVRANTKRQFPSPTIAPHCHSTLDLAIIRITSTSSSSPRIRPLTDDPPPPGRPQPSQRSHLRMGLGHATRSSS